MNNPTPIPTPSTTGLTPSGSTSASSVGGALAIVVIAVLTQHHWLEVDPITAAAITALFTAGLGYLPSSGRL